MIKAVEIYIAQPSMEVKPYFFHSKDTKAKLFTEVI